MENKSAQRFPRDLGVVATPKRVLLYINLSGSYKSTFQLGASTNGLSFKRFTKEPSIADAQGHIEDTRYCKDFRISAMGKQYILLYKVLGSEPHLSAAVSKDAVSWTKIGTIHSLHATSMIVPDYTYQGQHVAYTGDGDIRIAYAKENNFTEWTENPEVLIAPRPRAYDKFPIEVGNVLVTERGILVLYYVKVAGREAEHYTVGAALFDRENPEKLLWRCDEPVWTQPDEWLGKRVYPLGALKYQEKFILYFGIEGESVTAVAFSNFDDVFNLKAATASVPVLKKHMENPIISPVMHHTWESMSTFNPAAVYEGGKVHLLYRAQGESSTSTLGYATSSDGVTVDERHTEPAYWPTQPFETPGGTPFHPNIAFMSGGGWGGCEDPRLTKIENKFYLTYVAYNGRDHPRVAISSIEVEDFIEHKWNKWATPKLISPPGVVDKNAVLFPEKVNGKYVMMHRIFPNILIDFLDDLDFENGQYLKGEHMIKPRENSWDSRKAGAGPPPIKTKDGWLLIYHAVDDRDDRQYKIGAMLLDLDDPTRVLYRSNVPILRPSEWYENEGFKAGVAYPCGAVVIKNHLYVYYGGADSYVCVAAQNLDEFLSQLKNSSPVREMPVPMHYPVLAHV